MKGRSCLILIALGAWLAAAGITAENARAFGIRVGPYAWCAWWKPAFEDWMLRSSFTRRHLSRMRAGYDFKPSILYGPVLTLDFTNRINLTSVFVLGRYRLRASVAESLTINNFIFSHPDISINKYDLDSTLNIILNPSFKIFCGFKYQHYNYSKVDLISIPFYSFQFLANDTVMYHGVSAGAGAGFIFKLTDSFFLLWNVSLLYQRPIVIIKQKQYLIISSNVYPLNERIMPDYNALGVNATLTFSYVFRKISTTLALGLRYQYLYTFGNDVRGIDFDKNSDHFYGITLAAVYSYQTVDKISGGSTVPR
ncbi:MAG: hypothetical protein A2176_06590 [Spirochaetes bacterium RBG_13_51_14]|nr:MAG: hypothetical protein A2176_06590 [Spirochaetes bacterium RBG_13_51_14]